MEPVRAPYRSTPVKPIAMVVIALALPAWAVASPQYDSDECRRAIEQMLDAHGGLDRWRSAPAVRFSSHLEVNFGGDNWVPYWEDVTVEISTRRAYLDLPNPDGSSGRIAFDGEKAWSAGNLQGLGRAPARFTAWRNFYLFNLPWMTQDDGVHLAAAGRGTIPNDSKSYTVVEMTFDDDTGDTPKDHYKLFIDPATHRLHAAEYVMTFPGMTNGKPESPPSVFVWEETQTVGGLTVPKRYTVYWTDGRVAVKDGEVKDWSFAAPFDESMMTMPEDGKPDQSMP